MVKILDSIKVYLCYKSLQSGCAAPGRVLTLSFSQDAGRDGLGWGKSFSSLISNGAMNSVGKEWGGNVLRRWWLRNYSVKGVMGEGSPQYSSPSSRVQQITHTSVSLGVFAFSPKDCHLFMSSFSYFLDMTQMLHFFSPFNAINFFSLIDLTFFQYRDRFLVCRFIMMASLTLIKCPCLLHYFLQSTWCTEVTFQFHTTSIQTLK